MTTYSTSHASTANPSFSVITPARKGFDVKTQIVSASSMSMMTISTIASSYDLLQIAAGTDMTQRIGRRIRVHRILFSGVLVGAQNNSAADDPWDAVRLTIAKVRPGFTPGAGWTCHFPLDPRINSGLLEVLSDQVVVVSTNGHDSVGYIQGARPLGFSWI